MSFSARRIPKDVTWKPDYAVHLMYNILNQDFIIPTVRHSPVKEFNFTGARILENVSLFLLEIPDFALNTRYSIVMMAEIRFLAAFLI